MMVLGISSQLSSVYLPTCQQVSQTAWLRRIPVVRARQEPISRPFPAVTTPDDNNPLPVVHCSARSVSMYKRVHSLG